VTIRSPRPRVSFFPSSHSSSCSLLLAPCSQESPRRSSLRMSPQPAVHLLCELLASACAILPGAGEYESLVRRLFKTSPGLHVWLFEKRFPVSPFIGNIDARRILPGVGHERRVLRRRWRLLRKLLLSADGGAPAGSGLETTTSDLRFVSSAGRRPGRVESEWRIHGRAVLSKEAALPERSVKPLCRHYWGGAGSRKTAFWEKLISAQAAELGEVRRLAMEVGRRTGRVVLSWHNASLGAAGGWAFEEMAARFDSPELYGRFIREVREEAERIRRAFDFSSAAELFEMRSERIFSRKMARALEHRQVCSNFAALDLKTVIPVRPTVSYPSGQVFPDLPGYLFQGPGIGSEAEWPGALSPHQVLSPERLRTWIDRARKGWRDGLVLLFALARQGQKLLDSGKIDSLVLPWIDKFFISSRRAADGIYLERLIRFVSSNIGQPLILFWEDTARREAPSLGLALEDLAGRGVPVRGIGIFGPGEPSGGSYGAERADAVRIILDEYPQKALFALRPLNENRCPGAFRRVFKDLDMGLFLNYDSSWKDNLAFLYAGTQVFALLSEQSEMESVSPWICAGGKRFAFGAWLRRMLRRMLRGDPDRVSCPVWLEYGSWANLL